jgi:ubiquinone/menaquinone biosynthesis C-methylase UbiE
MFTERDRRKCEELYEKYYAGRRFHDSLYSDLIRRYLRPGTRLLDAGCGRYLRFCREFAREAHVVGIDLEETFDCDNTSAPFAVRGDIGALPFPDESFDMVISRSVVEHLVDPPRVFGEFCRVLKPGGVVVIITPNRYDYVSIIAALTPYRVHQMLVSRIFRVPKEDVFPTLYRANTMAAMRRAMSAAGLVESEMETVNHYPAYLMFSPVLFRLGVLYERLTSTRALQQLRGSILCAFRRPPANSSREEHSAVTSAKSEMAGVR